MPTLNQMIDEAGLTRSELARKSGVERTLVYKHASGKQKPGIESSRKYAAALRISLDEFVRLLSDDNSSSITPRSPSGLDSPQNGGEHS